MTRTGLDRLLRPRSLAFVGGKAAAEAARQSKAFGFGGLLWPVNPHRAEMAGLPCFADIASLPEAPDAVFMAVPDAASITMAGEMATAGAGGAICYAAGFAETGAEGAQRQADLVAAAGAMPLIGPNCYGMINAFDRVALWPDQHGCVPIDHGRGVAIISQSGNLALNLTMQARGLPIGYMISVGNCAAVSPADLIEALIADPRVSAIGLHLEGLGSVARLSAAFLAARRAKVPLVVLKTGSSARGAELTLSHTSSLAGADALCDALFARYGVARVHDPASFVEALKLLHVSGPLKGLRVTSASCSGGEATLTADLAERHCLTTPDFPTPAQQRLEAVLGDRVHVANPLDYHTYIWGDGAAQQECFAGLLSADFEASILILDLPRADQCKADDWDITLQAFVAAHRQQAPRAGTVRLVASSLSDNLPEQTCSDLLAAGIVPAAGLAECLGAIAAAAQIGRAWDLPEPAGLVDTVTPVCSRAALWDEARSKAALAEVGIAVPASQTVNLAEIEALCVDDRAPLPVSFPLVLKALSPQIAHKTECGAVALNISSRGELLARARKMAELSDRFLIEQMIGGAVAELIVGVARDPQFGLFLSIGAGGIFVELLKQVELILLPASRAEIETALDRLPVAALLAGFRGRGGGDRRRVVDAILAVADFAENHVNTLEELEINPLLALPDGAVAVDALIRMREPADDCR